MRNPLWFFNQNLGCGRGKNKDLTPRRGTPIGGEASR